MSSPDPHDYAAEKAESERLDLAYGFAIAEVEARIREETARADSNDHVPQTWAHLSPQVFQTPYAELARIVEDADPDRQARTWVDLGCAYGRLGIVLARLRPGVEFHGLEIAAPRVAEAMRVYARLGLDPHSLRHADAARDGFPAADIYLIYDFGHRDEIATALERLRRIAQSRPIAVVGRGRAIRDAIEREHPWLAGVVPPVHLAHYSVYRSGQAALT